MVLHVALRVEALSTAQRARKRPLIRVDSHMNFQVLLLAERPIATREGTPERLSPVVLVHVRPQANLPVEDFPAASVAADERRLPLLFVLLTIVGFQILRFFADGGFTSLTSFRFLLCLPREAGFLRGSFLENFTPLRQHGLHLERGL